MHSVHDYRCPRSYFFLLAQKQIPSPINWRVNKRPYPEKLARLSSTMGHYQPPKFRQAPDAGLALFLFFSILQPQVQHIPASIGKGRRPCAQQVPISNNLKVHASAMPLLGQLCAGMLQTSHIFKDTLGNSQHIPHLR